MVRRWYAEAVDGSSKTALEIVGDACTACSERTPFLCVLATVGQPENSLARITRSAPSQRKRMDDGKLWSKWHDFRMPRGRGMSTPAALLTGRRGPSPQCYGSPFAADRCSTRNIYVSSIRSNGSFIMIAMSKTWTPDTGVKGLQGEHQKSISGLRTR